MNSDNDADFPWLVDVNVFMTPKSTIGGWIMGLDSVYVNNGYAQHSSPAQNNEVAWDVLLSAGTWTFEQIYVKSFTVGIYHVEIDGVEVGTFDGYNGSSIYNQKDTVAGITIAESGVHELKLVMATKNASSSNYANNISHIQLRRTA